MNGYSVIGAAALFAAVLTAGCGPDEPATPAPAADLVLVNGRIYTVNEARGWAEAVAIQYGRIAYVGDDEGARALAGSQTRLVDLGGRLVLPGLHDVHIHPISGGIEALSCDLNALTSLDQYLAAIAACAADHPERPWITGGGWLMSVFGPGAAASRKLLDQVVPDRPVYLSSADGHSAWVNSKALEIAGITAGTPNPPDGIIDREPGTEVPLGSLQEGAMDLVEAHLPPQTLESRAAGLRYAVEMLNGYGVTSIQDASAGAEDLAAYRALETAGELTLRVVAAQWWDRHRGTEQIAEFERRRTEFAGRRVRATSVKIMQDGVMENFTAAMLEPYLGQDGARGFPMVEPEALKRAVTELDAAGFQVHFHAIGDAAIRQCLDAVEDARTANGERGNRHHISHLELIDPADVPRFRELAVVANFQPLWAYPDEYITDLTVPFIGPERSRWLYPIASVKASGARVAFGSDWSVSTANPYPQIEVALTRRAPAGEPGEPLRADEAVSLADAIAAFTIEGALVNGSEADTGSIEVGKYADLVVLDRNLFEIDPAAISEARAVLTLLEGEVVHGDLAGL